MLLPNRSVLLFVVSALCCAPLQAAPPWKRAYRAERDLIRATEQANAKYARAAAQYQKKIQKQEEKYLRQTYRAGILPYRAGILPLSCYAAQSPAPTYHVIQQPGQRRVVISSPATYAGPTPVRTPISRTVPRPIGRSIVSSAPVINRPGRPTQVTQQQPSTRLPETPVVDSRADPPRGRPSSATVVDQLVIETEPVPELMPTPMAVNATAVVPASASDGRQPTPAKRPK